MICEHYKKPCPYAGGKEDGAQICFHCSKNTAKGIWPTITKTPTKTPILEKVRNVAQALVSKRVSLEIFNERTTICESCDYVKTRNGSKYCGQCGCSVLKDDKQILNLAHVEENLPRWGCKHPQRAQGKGWVR